MAVLMTVVVFATISPTLGQQFGKLIEVSTALCLLVYLYACTAIALPRVAPSHGVRHDIAGLHWQRWRYVFAIAHPT
jgi:hypothetical protein